MSGTISVVSEQTLTYRDCGPIGAARPYLFCGDLQPVRSVNVRWTRALSDDAHDPCRSGQVAVGGLFNYALTWLFT